MTERKGSIDIVVNKGLTLSVVGTHYPFMRGSYEGGVQIEPDEPESFDIESVFVPSDPERTDISEMISVGEMEWLSMECCKHIRDARTHRDD